MYTNNKSAFSMFNLYICGCTHMDIDKNIFTYTCIFSVIIKESLCSLFFTSLLKNKLLLHSTFKILFKTKLFSSHVTSSHQNPILPFHPSFKQLLLTSRYRYRLGIYSLGWWEQDKPFIEQQKHIFFQFYTQNIGIFSYKSKDLFPLNTLQMTVFLFLPLPWLLIFVPCSVFLYASFNAHTDACSSLHPPSFT